MTAMMNHLAGIAAEEAVADDYAQRGLTLVARRWRGRAGEIDLILRDAVGLVFVEVKKSSSHARALARVSRRQISRIMTAATEFVAAEPAGLLTQMRFDVATVDQSGRIRVLENAFL